VIAALVLTLSPIHDDRHDARAARTLAACPEVDAIYIKDPGGLLSARRASTLIPAIKAEIGSKPLELHSHCTIGLGELLYMEAPDYGVSAVQCASGATADGISNPPSLRVVENLRALGHTVPVDTQALIEVNRFFTRIAQAEGLPVGAPQAFDAAYLRHQLPGGMIGTMRRHLAEHRLAHLEAAVIEEIGRVREELGWPIVMTPFSQILLTQAVLNVTGRARYAVIPDEAIRYALGRFGRPNIPIAPEVMERIESLPRTRELRAEPALAPLAEPRRWMPCRRRVRRRATTIRNPSRSWSCCARFSSCATLPSSAWRRVISGSSCAAAHATERPRRELRDAAPCRARPRDRGRTRRGVRRRWHAAAEQSLARQLPGVAGSDRGPQRAQGTARAVRAAHQRQCLPAGGAGGEAARGRAAGG
jgi:hypothetical protein